jgi:hypothetical protein
MNLELNSIVEDMKSRRNANPNSLNPYDVNNYNIAQMAHLLALLAEENAKSSRKIEKLTNVLIGLTIVIALLTAVLVFFEFRTENKKIDQNYNFKTEQTQQNKQSNVTKK